MFTKLEIYFGSFGEKNFEKYQIKSLKYYEVLIESIFFRDVLLETVRYECKRYYVVFYAAILLRNILPRRKFVFTVSPEFNTPTDKNLVRGANNNDPRRGVFVRNSRTCFCRSWVCCPAASRVCPTPHRALADYAPSRAHTPQTSRRRRGTGGGDALLLESRRAKTRPPSSSRKRCARPGETPP